jgi:hypothetical protein
VIYPPVVHVYPVCGADNDQYSVDSSDKYTVVKVGTTFHLTAKEGYIFNGGYSTVTLYAPDDENIDCPPTVIYVPTVPVVVTCGPNNDVYGTVPSGHYTSRANVNGSVTLTAMQGYVFAGGETVVTLPAPHDYNTMCPPKVIYPPAVHAYVVCGPHNDEYSVEASDKYTVVREGNTFKVTAKEGYVFAGDKTKVTLYAPKDENTECPPVYKKPELKVEVMPCVVHEDGEMDDESMSQEQMNGEVRVTVTNPNNKNASFSVWLDGGQKMDVNVTANSSKTVTFHEVSVGNHVVTLKDKEHVVATEYFKVPKCEKQHEHGLVQPTVVVKAEACSTATSTTGTVTVMVTNNSHGNRKFTVTLAGQFTMTTERLQQGESATLTFTHVPAGTHTVVVSAKPVKFLTVSTHITVATCVTPVVPPVTPPTTTVPSGGRGSGQVLGVVTVAAVTPAVTTPVGGRGSGEVLGATTQLANTGDNSIANIIVGFTVIAMALGLTAVSRKQQS